MLFWLSNNFALKINEHRKLMLQNCGRTADSFFRVDCAVCFQIKNQLIKVSTLFNTSVLNRIGISDNWCVRRIQQELTY